MSQLRTKEEVLEGAKILNNKVESSKAYLNFMMQQMNNILSSEELDEESRYDALYSIASRYTDHYINQYIKARQDSIMWCNPLTIATDLNDEYSG